MAAAESGGIVAPFDAWIPFAVGDWNLAQALIKVNAMDRFWVFRFEFCLFGRSRHLV